MRDRTHAEQVVRWAKMAKSSPRGKWRTKHKEFIDSQIIQARKFLEKVAKSKGGKEKIYKLKRIPKDRDLKDII